MVGLIAAGQVITVHIIGSVVQFAEILSPCGLHVELAQHCSRPTPLPQEISSFYHTCLKLQTRDNVNHFIDKLPAEADRKALRHIHNLADGSTVLIPSQS